MRLDMAKVLVERPRPPSRVPRGRDGRKFRDMSEAAFLPMKAGYRDLKSLNENLRPLERYLSRQVNRPWDMVYREMCAVIDGRSAVQRHILEHLRQYVAIRTSVVDGELIDLGNRFFGLGPSGSHCTFTPGPDCCAGTHRMSRGVGAIANGSKSLNGSVPIAGANSPPAANCTGSMGNGSSWRSQLCRRPLRRCGIRCGAVVSRKEQARQAARWNKDMRSSSSAGRASTPPRSVSWRHERCATMGFSAPHNRSVL